VVILENWTVKWKH